MSSHNAFSAPFDTKLYPNKEDEMNSLCYDNSTPMYMTAIQDQFGITSWTVPDSFNSCAFESFLQPTDHLQSNAFPITYPSLPPGSIQSASGPNAFGFSPLSTASLDSQFIPSDASAQQLYLGSSSQSPAAPNGLYSELPPFGGNGASPSSHPGFLPFNSSLTYPQFGSSQIDMSNASVSMNTLTPPVTGVCDYAPAYGTAPVPAIAMTEDKAATPEALPSAPRPPAVAPRAKGKKRSKASPPMSVQLTEPEAAQAAPNKSKKTDVGICSVPNCNMIFSTKSICARHEKTHYTNPYYCALPRCRSNITKNPKLGFNRSFSMRRHLLSRLAREGEQSKCVVAARARGWTHLYCSEDVLRTGRPPRE